MTLYPTALHLKEVLVKLGSYIGTGAAGNKDYTGFEPAFIMTKRSSTSGDDWNIIDNVRDTDTNKNAYLKANTDGIEVDSGTSITFNRDGFTLNGGSFNTSSQTHIYYAVAKNTNETSLIDTDLQLHLDAASFDGSTNTPTTWTDSTSNSNNGTITGATFDSELGNYLDFDGSGDYVSIASNSAIQNATNYSVETWIRPDSLSGLPHLWSIYGSGNKSLCYINDTNGNINFTVYNNSGDNALITSNSSVKA